MKLSRKKALALMVKLCVSDPGPRVSNLVFMLYGRSAYFREFAWKILKGERVIPRDELILMVQEIPSLRTEAWEKLKREFFVPGDVLFRLGSDLRLGSAIQADIVRILAQRRHGKCPDLEEPIAPDPDHTAMVDKAKALQIMLAQGCNVRKNDATVKPTIVVKSEMRHYL